MRAFITGGARGIGFGIAKALVNDGWNLILSGRTSEENVRPALDILRDLSDEYSNDHSKKQSCECSNGQSKETTSRNISEPKSFSVEYFQGDVSSKADRTRWTEEIARRWGSVDALVNNAGIAPRIRADILDASEESFDELMNVNLKGPYFLTQAIANQMIRQKEQQANFVGKILNIGSMSATVVSVNRGEYCLSKAGVAMSTKLWAVRLAEFGIDVFEIQPGIIATDMTAGVKEKYDRLIAGGLTVQKRWGFPEDIGKAAAMLLRGDLPYATGSVLSIDGGLTTPRL